MCNRSARTRWWWTSADAPRSRRRRCCSTFDRRISSYWAITTSFRAAARAPAALKGTGRDRACLNECAGVAGASALSDGAVRMHPHICKAVSRRFYQDQLDTAPATAEERARTRRGVRGIGRDGVGAGARPGERPGARRRRTSIARGGRRGCRRGPGPRRRTLARTPQSQRSPSTRDNTWRFSRRCRRRSRWSA